MNASKEIKPMKFKDILKIILVFIFVYVILFEFILPMNRILPKPSLLIDSFGSLWKDYDLFYAFGLSTTILYSALLIGYLLIQLFSSFLIKMFYALPGLSGIFRITKYFPAFFFAVLFAYWFPKSITAEFVFVFLAVVSTLKIELYLASQKVKEEYILSGLSLGLQPEQIYKKIVWKSVQPTLFKSLIGLHFYLWSLILIYEFLAQTEGLGTIYRWILYYRDFASIFALGIFVSILIWIGKGIIVYFKNKMIFWES